eukprot:6999546-Prymnesium_polylepis.1
MGSDGLARDRMGSHGLTLTLGTAGPKVRSMNLGKTPPSRLRSTVSPGSIAAEYAEKRTKRREQTTCHIRALRAILGRAVFIFGHRRAPRVRQRRVRQRRVRQRRVRQGRTAHAAHPRAARHPRATRSASARWWALGVARRGGRRLCEVGPVATVATVATVAAREAAARAGWRRAPVWGLEHGHHRRTAREGCAARGTRRQAVG